MIRLDRAVAQRTGWSRTQAGRAIRDGRIAIGGSVAADPAGKVPDDVVLAIDGEALVDEPEPPRIALFHKPLGVLSTVGDDHGRLSLASTAEALLQLGLHPVGRLDADTDGLLLFSADGATTQRLLHPRRAVPRTYLAVVEGRPGPRFRHVIASGVPTSDGPAAGTVVDIDGDRVTLEVTEGRHRMVRRMLANAGHPVVTLRRLQYGPFALGDLAPGAHREATEAELAALDAFTGA